MERKNIPVIVMEEHKEAYYVWHIFSSMEKIPAFDNILLHVDHHYDCLGGVYNFDPNLLPGDLEFSKHLSYDEFGIANFIIPAVYEKMFVKTILLLSFENKIEKFGRAYFCRKYREVNGVSRGFLDFIHLDKEQKKQIDEDEKKNIIQDIRGVDYAIGGLADYGSFTLPVVLDIDLDYFCWSDSLKDADNPIAEITEEAWHKIMSDTFNPFRIFAENKCEFYEKDGKYYLELVNPNKYGYEDEIITQEVVEERVEKFFTWLAGQKFVPAAIDICRSRISGYLNKEYFPWIENEILRRLDELYGTEVLFCPTK